MAEHRIDVKMIRYYSKSIQKESFFASRSIVSRSISEAASRKYRGSIDSNVYNKIPPVYYMDVGAWAGGADGKPKTTFGMISGRDVFLCSWMNLSEGGLSAAKVNQREGASVFWNGLSRGSKAFFQAGSSIHRIYILGWARLPNKLGHFCQEHTVYLIVGDLHLHLQAGGPIDRFRYKHRGSLRSLDSELYNLINLKKKLTNQKIKLISVQLGDLYEVWEAECILRHRLLQLKEYIEKTKRNALPGARVRSDMKYMLQNHLVHKSMLKINMIWQHYDDRYHYTPGPQELHRSCVDASSTDDIVKKIRNAHKSLFRGKKKIFDVEVRGNHDNFFSNRFWSKKSCAPSDYYKYPELRFKTKGAKSFNRRIHLKTKNPICMEHGHRWDWHNNDSDWYKKDHGFDTVFDLISGWMNTWLSSGTSAKGTDIVRTAGDVITDLMNFEMRHFIILRADSWLRWRKVRLFVTGHTHSPCIIQTPKTYSLFWMHPHALYYYASKYCMPGARSIAKRLYPSSLLARK